MEFNQHVSNREVCSCPLKQISQPYEKGDTQIAGEGGNE